MQDILDKAGKGGGPGHYALVKALKTKYKGKSPKTQKRAMPEGKSGKVRVNMCSVCVLCVSGVCLVCVLCVSVFKLNACSSLNFVRVVFWKCLFCLKQDNEVEILTSRVATQVTVYHNCSADFFFTSRVALKTEIGSQFCLLSWYVTSVGRTFRVMRVSLEGQIQVEILTSRSQVILWYTTTVAPTLLTSRLSPKRETKLEICTSWGVMGWPRLVGSLKITSLFCKRAL